MAGRVTVFLRSLTHQNWSGKLIAVIVSGYGGDGAAALCDIREMGGTTIAQKLETATQPDMLESAIASGCIDFILSPEDIGRRITRIMQKVLPPKIAQRLQFELNKENLRTDLGKMQRQKVSAGCVLNRIRKNGMLTRITLH